jgi:hypothetical protein
LPAAEADNAVAGANVGRQTRDRPYVLPSPILNADDVTRLVVVIWADLKCHAGVYGDA